MLATEAFDVDARKQVGVAATAPALWPITSPSSWPTLMGPPGMGCGDHEAGHAFADYTTANNRYVVELGVAVWRRRRPTSMSMEFCLALYGAVFGEDAGRYEFMRTCWTPFSFLPYGTIVDDFQRQVYENPDWTPAERKAAWRQLEAEFRPHITFDGIPLPGGGTRWQYQMHIYETPFYYIDYCLAQTGGVPVPAGLS